MTASALSVGEVSLDTPVMTEEVTMNHTFTRVAVAVLGAGFALVATGSPASAHPHQVSVAHQGAGQVLANGANHGPYTAGLTCGGNAAAYGLETAHHGPDAGTSGKADGCYQLNGTVPAQDVTNPVIK